MQDIHVYERLPAPAASDNSSVWADTARFYLIGLGGRGQKALQELSAWEPVKRRSVIVLGRKDWAPGAGVDEGVERIFGDDRPYKTSVIPRDRLAGVLREVAHHGDRAELVSHEAWMQWARTSVVAFEFVKLLEAERARFLIRVFGEDIASAPGFATGVLAPEDSSALVAAAIK